MGLIHTNFAASTLTATLASGATGVGIVQVSNGSKFPAFGGGDWTYLVLEDASLNHEIIKINGRASNAMDIPAGGRGLGGTVTRAWAPGDIVSLRMIGLLLDDAIAEAEATAAAALTAHEAAADPHPGYTTPAEVAAGYQPLDAMLTALAALTTTADNGLYFTGADTPAQFPLTAFARTLLDDADQATALATLGAALNGVTALSGAYSVVAADRGKLFDCTGTWSLSLLAAATAGNGFVVAVRNSGTGTITIDPNGAETIDGAGTITLGAGEVCIAVCDGTGWKTVGRTMAAGRLLRITTFTSSGTWTKQSDVGYVVVEVVGGGGGGSNSSGTGGAGGGGAGGYARKKIAAGSLGSTETVTIPAAASYGVPGSTGGTVTFGAHCSATGGTGGNSTAGGSGGTGVGGDLNLYGGGGGSTNYGIDNSGGGSGGNSVLGGGGSGGGGPGASGQPGRPNTGGGGGGGASYAGSGAYGGAGGTGIVIVYEYS